jgi:tetratricopeptide (TPR) repeat protein
MFLSLALMAISRVGVGAFTPSASVYLRILVIEQPATAQKVADLLAQGTPFALLASEYSIDSTKKDGGFMGQVKLAELQEQVRTAVKNLQVGEITGPIQVQAGLAFFQRTTMDYYAKALPLIQSKHYQAALTHLGQDLALNPDRVHSLELKTYALQQLGRSPEAKPVYREIIRREPINVLAHVNLGVILDKEGRHTEAAGLFEQAVHLDPAQDVAMYNLALIYASHLPDLPKALGYIQQAIALQPGAAHYYATLADIYTKQGKPQEARRALALAAQFDPHNATYHDRLAALEPSAPTSQTHKTAGRPQAPASHPVPAPSASQPVRNGKAAVSQPTAPATSIKVVTLPGGEDSSRVVMRQLQHNGFPVTLHINDSKPMSGIRIFHKPHATETAHKLQTLIDPGSRLKRLTWKSRFDIIV